MRILMLLMATAIIANAQTNEVANTQTNDVTKVRVTGDRVSIRVAPDLDSYLLDRAMRGEEMVYYGQSNGWVAVQAPESIDLWVSAQYLQNGVVQPDKLNVRAGPNLNYPVVAVVEKGDEMNVRGQYNGWVKIAPPEGSKVWISQDYAEIIHPPVPVPAVKPVPAPEAVAKEAPAEAAPSKEPEVKETEVNEQKSLPPLMLIQDKTKKQGEYVEIPGVLRRANPGLYMLVLVENGMEEPICLVRGYKPQMEKLLNRSILIKGKRYWVKDSDLPVVQPEKIHLDPIITE